MQEEHWCVVQETGSTGASGKAAGQEQTLRGVLQDVASLVGSGGFVASGKLGVFSFSACFQAD